MIVYLLSFFLVFSAYALPMNLEKAGDYNKKFEAVEKDEDLERLNSRFFNREPVTFKKLNPGADLAESGKGSMIYFAYANDGTPLAVIKKLPLDDSIDREELNDEVNSLYERYFHGAKNFHVPRLIGTAEFATEDDTSAYIIESVASGKSINNLVKDTASKSGNARFFAYRNLKNSIETTAKSFAEMHQVKSTKSYASYYDDYYQAAKDGTFSGPYGIIHGDAHLGNIFYDTKSGKTTFIDLSFMPRSIQEGAPVGLDCGKFIFTLEAISAFYGLSVAEIDELTSTFSTTYLAHNKEMSNSQMEKYVEVAYKDFAFPEDTFGDDSTSQGDFLYRYAVAKVGKEGKTSFA
ncbi:aminoglycoside phosphotransferase family protein [bacterium]|nr:aminoglycoside phosphotransferase family protein [bacterium]